jgi:hypothetical protein
MEFVFHTESGRYIVGKYINNTERVKLLSSLLVILMNRINGRRIYVGARRSLR